MWPNWSRAKGVTYFDKEYKAFSIHEGQIPNIYMSWHKKYYGFYLCLASNFRIWWIGKRSRGISFK